MTQKYTHYESYLFYTGLKDFKLTFTSFFQDYQSTQISLIIPFIQDFQSIHH